MTASKDINVARPTSQHRLSVGSPASSLTSRQRPHSHSLSVGSINHAHRVTRRKSTSATNNAAVMAAVKGGAASPLESASFHGRRNPSSKGAAGPRGQLSSAFAAMSGSLPNHASAFPPNAYMPTIAQDGSAVTDGPPIASMPENARASNKSRIRRASEGSRLSKGEAKRTTGSDLKCEKCGKGYKHSSCLTKHLWEHTPEWAITSKLLISKHQQVQLLEAASVLVAMNQEKAEHSDGSSASPAASGSSDAHEDAMSSNDTTPPPQLDDMSAESYSANRAQFQRINRRTSNSSAYSHSYQSQSSVFSDAASTGRPYLSHFRQWSADTRPATSATSATSVTDGQYDQEDHADLAAAVGLLSCSYGTPKSGPVMLPADVPPVPPLPAKFLGHSVDMQAEKGNIVQPYISNERSYQRYDREMKDADMDEDFADEDDFDRHSRSRSDEDDEGMFGRMEE